MSVLSSDATEADEEVLILTGPPGAGKTTIAGLLAAKRERAVHLETDFFWNVIASGYIEPWKPESHEQNTLVMEVVAAAAARYARAGYFTVIDGIISPRWFFEPLRAALTKAGLRMAYVILLPALPIAAERATARSSTRLSGRRVIEQLWGDFADPDQGLAGHVIDNSDLTAAEAAAAVEERLRQGKLTV